VKKVTRNDNYIYVVFALIQIVTDVEVTIENYFPVVGNIPRGRRTRGIFTTTGR